MRRRKLRRSLLRILACAVVTAGLAACSSHQESPSAAAPAAGPAHPAPRTSASASAPSNASKAAVRSVVERFGKRMQTLSVLAPPDDIRGELPATYGKLITPGLMTAWRAHPDEVIGREGSSPWPTQIVIDGIDCSGAEGCRVTGKVDYITSNEVEHGGVFYRRDIALDVARSGDGWRIAAVRLGPAPR